MRVLGIDGGAERLGWGIVESTPTGPVYIDSGLVRMPRGASPFQDYRVTFIERYVKYLTAPGSVYDQEIVPIDAVVNETVPAVGSYGGTQMYLVNVAVTVVQALAIERDIPVHQVGATTVQKAMVGKRPKGKKITKAQVRNGVIDFLPVLKPRKKDWVKVWDEPDALAAALTFLGYKV